MIHFMKEPIIVSNIGDVLLFTSVSAAKGYIELIDVKNNEYTGYDCEGRLLNFQIVFKERDRNLKDRIESFEIVAAEDHPNHSDELVKIIVHFLERVGETKEKLSSLSLSELVEMLKKYALVI